MNGSGRRAHVKPASGHGEALGFAVDLRFPEFRAGCRIGRDDAVLAAGNQNVAGQDQRIGAVARQPPFDARLHFRVCSFQLFVQALEPFCNGGEFLLRGGEFPFVGLQQCLGGASLGLDRGALRVVGGQGSQLAIEFFERLTAALDDLGQALLFFFRSG